MERGGGWWRSPITRAVIALTLVPVTVTLPPAPASAAARSVSAACPDGLIAEDGFGDVNVGNVHEYAIDCLVHWQVTQGVGGGRFAPHSAVTRGQMATFLVRALEGAGATFPTARNAFSDDGGSVHEPAIDKLAAAGVAGGVGGSRYAPDRAVSRGQMASLLANAFQAATGQPLPFAGDAFPDDTASVHHDPINRIAAAGIAAGNAGAFSPGAVVRRDQMASFLARLLDVLVAGGWARVPQPPQTPSPDGAVVPTPTADWRSVDCTRLAGAGSFSNPLQIGVVDRSVAVLGCAPLTSGQGFNTVYFSFTLPAAATSPTIAGARFTLTPDAVSAVHPRLAAPGGLTLLRSSTDGFWTGTSPNFTGRWLPLAPLPGGGVLPAGEYRLGMEKMDSPLRSLTTPRFDVLIALGS